MDLTGGTADAVCLGSFMTFNNHFGTSVAAMGDNVLIGVPDTDFQGVIDSGRAYLMSPDSAWPILTLFHRGHGRRAGRRRPIRIPGCGGRR